MQKLLSNPGAEPAEQEGESAAENNRAQDEPRSNDSRSAADFALNAGCELGEGKRQTRPSPQFPNFRLVAQSG